MTLVEPAGSAAVPPAPSPVSMTWVTLPASPRRGLWALELAVSAFHCTARGSSFFPSACCRLILLPSPLQTSCVESSGYCWGSHSFSTASTHGWGCLRTAWRGPGLSQAAPASSLRSTHRFLRDLLSGPGVILKCAVLFPSVKILPFYFTVVREHTAES